MNNKFGKRQLVVFVERRSPLSDCRNVDFDYCVAALLALDTVSVDSGVRVVRIDANRIVGARIYTEKQLTVLVYRLSVAAENIRRPSGGAGVPPSAYLSK